MIVENGAQVDAPAVLLSTAKDIRLDDKTGKIGLIGLGATGAVVNDGDITAADGGLVALVAPNVANNGTINAKLGKVALAAGTQSATVDLYGDGLVELAPGGATGKVLASNDGVINAEGGTVALTAAAAKNVVDDVIRMDGAINASSFTRKGGAIVLAGGDDGAVAVKGTLNVSGEGGGTVRITGRSVAVAGTVTADGGGASQGGTVLIKAKKTARLTGSISAQGGKNGGDGGKVELSGTKVAYSGVVNTRATRGKTGDFLLDPADLTIGNGPGTAAGDLDQPYVNAQDIANTLGYSNVDLLADRSITVADAIDVSTYQRPAAANVIAGITVNRLTLTAPTVDIAHDITLGQGNLIVDAANLNLDGRIYGRDAVGGDASFIADTSRLDATGTVNVMSNAASINQGLAFAESGHTVTVGAGTFDEDIALTKANITLAGYRHRHRRHAAFARHRRYRQRRYGNRHDRHGRQHRHPGAERG